MVDITGFNRARREAEERQVEKPAVPEISDAMTVVQLRVIASERGIVNYARLNKADLLKVLQ